MLHQNWFMDKNFEMFEDYAESQSFYDIKTKNIYIVFEKFEQKGITTIQEIVPESFEYQIYYKQYKNWKNALEKLC